MSTLTETSNATTVGEAYQAFGRGDIATILGLLDSKVEWDVYPAGYVPHKLGVEHLKARRGPGEVVGFFAEIGTWTVIRFDVEEIIGDGPTVVARIAMEFELPTVAPSHPRTPTSGALATTARWSASAITSIPFNTSLPLAARTPGSDRGVEPRGRLAM